MKRLLKAIVRYLHPTPNSILTCVTIVCLFLILVAVLPDFKNALPQRPLFNVKSSNERSERSTAHERKLEFAQGSPEIAFSERATAVKNWRRRKTRWPTTLKQKWPTTMPPSLSTEFPFSKSKYYTYIEDFLANWDKYPMMADEKKRLKDVKEAATRLKNRILFTEALTKAQKNLVYDLLVKFDEIAKQAGIRYFAYGGTLLGSFRHHDLVPYDDDVDIIIDDNDREKLRLAVNKTSHGIAMSTLSPDHFKIHNKYGTFTNLYHDWTYPYIDISFYRMNETHLYDVAMTYGRWWAYRIQHILPLHPRPLGPLMIPAPFDTYKYLLLTYPDLSQCSEGFYSHQLEMVVRCRPVSTECKALPYPFVHRSYPSSGKGVNETLVFNGKVLSWKVVEEPEYQAGIQDPYTLKSYLTDTT